MASTTRKSRGPRTPHERARDAARSAATRLERTDDDELHAVATMLRFAYGSGWDDPRQVEAAAAARELLYAEWQFVKELDIRRRIEDLEVLAAEIRSYQSPERPGLELVKGGDDA